MTSAGEIPRPDDEMQNSAPTDTVQAVAEACRYQVELCEEFYLLSADETCEERRIERAADKTTWLARLTGTHQYGEDTGMYEGQLYILHLQCRTPITAVPQELRIRAPGQQAELPEDEDFIDDLHVTYQAWYTINQRLGFGWSFMRYYDYDADSDDREETSAETVSVSLDSKLAGEVPADYNEDDALGIEEQMHVADARKILNIIQKRKIGDDLDCSWFFPPEVAELLTMRRGH